MVYSSLPLYVTIVIYLFVDLQHKVSSKWLEYVCITKDICLYP